MKKVNRGDSLPITFYYTNSDDEAIDITGYTLWFTVRKKIAPTSIKTDDDAVISIKQTGAEITSPTEGMTIFSVTPEMTDIPPDTYIYDIQIKSALGVIRSIRVDDFVVAHPSSECCRALVCFSL